MAGMKSRPESPSTWSSAASPECVSGGRSRSASCSTDGHCPMRQHAGAQRAFQRGAGQVVTCGPVTNVGMWNPSPRGARKASGGRRNSARIRPRSSRKSFPPGSLERSLRLPVKPGSTASQSRFQTGFVRQTACQWDRHPVIGTPRWFWPVGRHYWPIVMPARPQTPVECWVSGASTDWTSNAENNRPNRLIIEALTPNQGASGFGPVIFSHPEKVGGQRQLTVSIRIRSVTADRMRCFLQAGAGTQTRVTGLTSP